MRNISLVECTEVTGGTLFIGVPLAPGLMIGAIPLTPEQQSAVSSFYVGYFGGILGVMAGAGIGAAFSAGSTALVGCTVVGAMAGAYGMGCLAASD